MTIPVTKPTRVAREVAGDTLAVAIGPQTLDLLEVAYRARRPVLLEGPTGIGKSQICAELAARLGIGYQVLDLSLLEPPDLVGLPVIQGGRTHYASPSELPTQGRGILMLEELNRAETPVMQPALQLLSARRLHAYELPPGWSCVAAVNPEGEDYQVNRMDPALRSRFMGLTVFADPSVWLSWAKQANVHAAVVRVVAEHADAFEHAAPRSWAYASDILHTLTDTERSDAALVRVALRGYLPTAWALVLASALSELPALPSLDASILFGPGGAERLGAMVQRLDKEGRPDGVVALAAKVRHLLSGTEFVERAEAGLRMEDVERLCASLPGDLREQCLMSAARSEAAGALLRSLGYDLDGVLRGAPLDAAPQARAALRAQLAAWRETLAVHRLALVASATRAWLRRTDDQLETMAGIAPALIELSESLGVYGSDLVRWLRVRGLVAETKGR